MTYKINRWEDWEELCFEYGLNPLGQLEFGIDMGGGNSEDFKYIGDVPEETSHE